MSNEQLFSTPSGFAAVRADTVKMFQMNPRLVFPLVVPRVRRAQVALVSVSNAPRAALLAAAAAANQLISDAQTTIDDAARAFMFDATTVAQLRGAAALLYTPGAGSVSRTRLLPLSLSAVRGTQVDSTYIYKETASGLLDSQTAAEMFGGTISVELRYEGVGKSALATLLNAGPYHVTINGIRSARATVDPEMDDSTRWVATKERVQIPRVFSVLDGGGVIEQISDTGETAERVEEGDMLGAARVTKSVGLGVKLSIPLPRGEYRVTLAGHSAAIALLRPLRRLTIPTALNDASERTLRDAAAALHDALASVSTREAWCRSALSHTLAIRTAHHAVGADHAISLLQDGRVTEYMALSEDMGSTRGMMASIVQQTTTAGF